MKRDHVICWGCARMTWQKIKHHWQSHQLTTFDNVRPPPSLWPPSLWPLSLWQPSLWQPSLRHAQASTMCWCIGSTTSITRRTRGILRKQVCSLFIFLCIPFTNYVYRYKKHWSMSIPPSRNIKKAQTMVYTVIWALGKFFLINFLFHKLSSQQQRRQGGMECEGTKE